MMGLKKMAADGHLRRQAVLLLLAMAAALMFSSGVALAATITCPGGKDVPCLGTPEPDTLEGSASIDVMYGRGDSDILKGRGWIDSLYGQGGDDKLFGGPGEDGLNGGPGNDELNGGGAFDEYLFVTNSWGKDSIADSTTSGSSLTFTLAEGAETEDLTINLFPGAGPEVKNASGTSTINWESTTLIKDVHSGDGDDQITGNLLGNNIIGRQGTDTISSLSGNDHIYVIDGEKDFVNCGSNLFGGQDIDHVEHDPFDEVSDNCEEKVPAT